MSNGFNQLNVQIENNEAVAKGIISAVSRELKASRGFFRPINGTNGYFSGFPVEYSDFSLISESFSDVFSMLDLSTSEFSVLDLSKSSSLLILVMIDNYRVLHQIELADERDRIERRYR